MSRYEVPSTHSDHDHPEQRGEAGRQQQNHRGVKMVVVRLISNKPCASFFVTLFLALVLGVLGLLFGGMNLDTEGWETRGTDQANRAIQHEVWREGKFGATLPNGGRPVARGSKNKNNDRRRARTLLGLAEKNNANDGEGDVFELETFVHKTTRKNLFTQRGGKKRSLLQDTSTSTSTASAAAAGGMCASPYFPTGGTDNVDKKNGGTQQQGVNTTTTTTADQAKQDALREATNEALNKDRDRFNDYSPIDLNLILYDADVDLWSPEGMAATCEAEDAIMSVAGYAEHCQKSELTCEGPPPKLPGLAATHVLTSSSSSSSFYKRCYPPNSYARYFMRQLGLTSCGEFRGVESTTTTTINATKLALVTSHLDAGRKTMIACADEFRASGSTGGGNDNKNKNSPCREAGFDAGAFNTGFGPKAPRLTATKIIFRLHRDRYDDTMTWLMTREKKGEFDVGRRGTFKVAYSTSDRVLKERKTDDALNSDMLLSALAVAVVSALVWLHTGSLLLTAGGMLQVILAFPTAVFTLTVVFGIQFFPLLNFLGIFVVAGVGADDCFVMYDKWIQAKSRLPMGASAEEVAGKCYWEATWAMFLTSITTAAAFMSSAVIPIAPIRVFSIFMAAMIIFDYIFDITVFASCLAFQHRLLIDYERRRESGEGDGRGLIALDFWTWLERRRRRRDGLGRRVVDGVEMTKKTDDEEKVEPDNTTTKTGATATTEGPLSERFFGDRVYPALHRARWPLVILLLAAGAAASWAAMGLTTPEDNNVPLLGDDDPLEKFDSLSRTAFLASTEGRLWVSVIFGLQPGDDGKHTNPQKRPNIRLDPSFDPTSVEAQVWITNFCRETALLRSSEWSCPSLQWSEWVNETTGLWNNYTACTTAANASSSSSTVNNCSETIWQKGRDQDSNGDDSHVSPTEFEEACGVNGFPVPKEKMERCMYRWANGRSNKLKSFYYPAGVAETEENVRLFLLRARFASNISWTSPLDVLQADYASWEDFVYSRIASAPAGLRGGYLTAEAFWWMDTIEAMQQGAYSAAGLTLLLAAVVILVGTGNVFIMVFSVVAIFIILSSVVAVVVAMGWTLGFLEGICFAILIGLSVDFVIHIGQGYVEAGKAGKAGTTEKEEAKADKEDHREPGPGPGTFSRHERSKRALAMMGYPVLSAGVTTLTSAIVLFFCQIIFFNKFGTIVMLSMVFATVITFGLYLPMLDALGPEGNFGDVLALFRRVTARAAR